MRFSKVITFLLVAAALVLAISWGGSASAKPAKTCSAGYVHANLSWGEKCVNSTGAGCEPGYSPCLPRVADLNCSDIPASKKPIRVTGGDPYGLDGDGDGYGCEP